MTTRPMNDHDKFVELYELYSQVLLNYAISIVKSSYIAEELVQDAFIKILKHIAEIEDPSSAVQNAILSLRFATPVTIILINLP